MSRNLIADNEFNLNILKTFNENWFLLGAGDFSIKQYNAMTVSWGSIGIMWGKPFAQVVVRPQRHTRYFMDEFDTFTISSFPTQYKKALGLLGSKSGRDGDKIAEAGLTPIKSNVAKAPSFNEAELVIECKKIYFHDLDPSHFLADYISPGYQSDYHRSYFGEILGIYGTDKFKQ